jgi:HD superfamily phosphohydrolase YqeK
MIVWNILSNGEVIQIVKIHGNLVCNHRFVTITTIIFLANNIEGEQESELLAEYEAVNKQKSVNSGSRSVMNNLSPNKRRNVK